MQAIRRQLGGLRRNVTGIDLPGARAGQCLRDGGRREERRARFLRRVNDYPLRRRRGEAPIIESIVR